MVVGEISLKNAVWSDVVEGGVGIYMNYSPHLLVFAMAGSCHGVELPHHSVQAQFLV